MRILIDESLPRALKKHLIGNSVSTVQELGWSSIKNGELLKRANANFDVLLTADQNMRYQQNLKGFDVSIIIFPSNRLETVLGLVTRLKQELQVLGRDQVLEL